MDVLLPGRYVRGADAFVILRLVPPAGADCEGEGKGGVEGWEGREGRGRGDGG